MSIIAKGRLVSPSDARALFDAATARQRLDWSERSTPADPLLKWFTPASVSYIRAIEHMLCLLTRSSALRPTSLQRTSAERAIFEKTFKVCKTLGEKAFSGYGPSGKPNSKLLSYHYEAFTLGLQKFLDSIRLTDAEQMDRIGTALGDLKQNERFITLTTGGGKNYARPLADRVKLVEDVVAEVI